MADTVKTTRELKIELGFADGDTRTIVVPNPIANITETQAKQAAKSAAGIFIGDKAGAAMTQFNSMTVVEKITTDLDLTTG